MSTESDGVKAGLLKPWCIYTASDLATWDKLPDTIKRQWMFYVGDEVEKHDSREESDRQAYLYHQWEPPLPFASWLNTMNQYSAPDPDTDPPLKPEALTPLDHHMPALERVVLSWALFALGVLIGYAFGVLSKGH